MALTQDVGAPPRPSAPGRTTWVLTVAGGLALIGTLAVVIGVLASHDSRGAAEPSSITGSGISITDERELAPFSSVELAGANRVTIHVGAPQSVAVSGDDNLVGRVTTVVDDGRLVIDNIGSFSTTAPMSVDISVPSLDSLSLGGTGAIDVDGISGDRFDAELAGAGTVTVMGSVDLARASLTGTGTIDLHRLGAARGIAELEGTGTIEIDAASTLEATLTGTGSIMYTGTPVVTMQNTGHGEVVPA
jgi:hypothetical protein